MSWWSTLLGIRQSVLLQRPKVLNPRDWVSKYSYYFDIWQTARQQCRLDACQNSDRWGNSYHQSRVIDTLRGPTIKFLTRYWNAWWRYQMETFSALLALCEGNPPVTGGFPSQRPVTRSFDVYFDLCLNKRLSKHLRRWWFETPSRHCDVI